MTSDMRVSGDKQMSVMSLSTSELRPMSPLHLSKGHAKAQAWCYESSTTEWIQAAVTWTKLMQCSSRDMKPLNSTTLAAMLQTKLPHFLQLRTDWSASWRKVYSIKLRCLPATWQAQTFVIREKCYWIFARQIIKSHLTSMNRSPAYPRHELHENIRIMVAAE